MTPELILKLEEVAGMFAFLAVELTLLFLIVSYLVGVLQQYLPPEKIQSILSAKNGRGYIVAALFGAITPFCSCSTIPFLKGLLRARAGFGPTLVFLFSSPLLNPIIIGLFVVTFSVDVAIFYFLVALNVSVTAGYVLEKCGFEKYVRVEAYAGSVTPSSCSAINESAPKNDVDNNALATAVTSCGGPEPVTAAGCGGPKVAMSNNGAELALSIAQESRWLGIWRSTWKDFKQVFPYLLLGISLGSFIYGFIPTDLITEYAGAGQWYAIIIAAVIGIPLYIRAEAVIPLSAALVQKGMAMGSVMALIIGSAGASLTEVVLLKSIFKTPMIIAFLSVIISMAIAAGYMYSYFFS